MDVSVIIVNYNTNKLLDDCLKSIEDNTKDIHYEVIVVDNASSDDSVNMIHNKYPWVKLIESKENLGFGKANNLGYKYSTGRNIFLLNSDTLLIENSIKTLSDVLDSDRSIGSVGAILIGLNGKQVHSYGKFPSIYKKLTRQNYVINEAHFEKMECVDYITGADLMIPRRIWEMAGGFDSKFFMYYEETDLQKRIASHGFKRVLVPHTKIIHLEGGSTGNKRTKNNDWKKITIFRSMLYYMYKHSNSIGFYLFRHLLLIKYSYMSKKIQSNNKYYEDIINCIREY